MADNTKRVSVILCCVLLLCFFAGCSEKETRETEITLIHGWGSTESDHVAMRSIYMDFEAQNPDVKINLISMPSSDDVIFKVQDMLTVGEIPDVIFTGGVGEDTLYRFMVENGYAVDLMPYVEEDAAFAEHIAEATKSRWMRDGALYTVSDVLLFSGYWYNTALFEQAGIDHPPTTWDEMIETCKTLTAWSEKTKSGVVSVVLDEEHLLYLTDALLSDAEGAALYDLFQKEPDFSSGAFQNAVQTIRSIDRYAETKERFTYRDTLEAFNSGKSAIYINGAWANTMIREEMDVRYAVFPSLDGAGTGCISSNLGYLIGNSGNAEKTEAAVRFLKYMLDDETQVRIVEETGQTASVPQVGLSAISGNERLLQAVECVQSAGHIIDTPSNLWKAETQARYLSYLKEVLSK